MAPVSDKPFYVNSVQVVDGEIRVSIEWGSGSTPATAIEDVVQWWSLDGKLLREE